MKSNMYLALCIWRYANNSTSDYFSVLAVKNR